jgi:predicted phage terminase large subunit-like protein
LELLETPLPSKYVPHQPTSLQAAFLRLPQFEVLYGGAAGGGKSDALLMAALQYVEQPGYSALLLRKTFTDLTLPDALMDRARQWLNASDAHWHEPSRTWRFPSGAKLVFGYLADENDKYRYQSSAFQFIGFDELTQFTETQYSYMLSRIRRLAGVEVPLRVRAATNPGGRGHEWVRQRFLTEGRPFVPAGLKDNPYLDTVEYTKALEMLDLVTRRQLLDGDWDIRPAGNLFRSTWFDFEECGPFFGLQKCRFWDLGGGKSKLGSNGEGGTGDWTAGALVARDREGFWWVLDCRRIRTSPAQKELFIQRTAEEDGFETKIRFEQEPGSSGRDLINYYQRRILSGYDVRAVPSHHDKVTRAGPFSSQAEAGLVKVVRGPWTTAWMQELESFPEEGVHDDQVDATVGAFRCLLKESTTKVRTAQVHRSVFAGVH